MSCTVDVVRCHPIRCKGQGSASVPVGFRLSSRIAKIHALTLLPTARSLRALQYGFASLFV